MLACAISGYAQLQSSFSLAWTTARRSVSASSRCAQPADAYVVVSRTLLQSMPEAWQHDLVARLERFSREMTERADDAGPSAGFKVEAGEWAGETFIHFLNGDPVPHYNRGRTRVEPRL